MDFVFITANCSPFALCRSSLNIEIAIGYFQPLVRPGLSPIDGPNVVPFVTSESTGLRKLMFPWTPTL